MKSGRYPRKGWFRRLNHHDEEHILASLSSVGMLEHRDKPLGALSGGQKQRAVIARMFASDPDIFVWMNRLLGWMLVVRMSFTN